MFAKFIWVTFDVVSIETKKDDLTLYIGKWLWLVTVTTHKSLATLFPVLVHMQFTYSNFLCI